MKAEEILKDVTNSKAINKDFNDYLSKNNFNLNKNIQFNVTVLSSASWPIKNQ